MRQDGHAARLVDEIERTAIEGELFVGRLRAAGQEDHGQGDAVATQARQQIDARDAGQAPVEHDDFGLGALGKGGQQRGAVGEGRHLEAVIAQLAAHRFAIVVVVVDECDPDFPFHVRTSFGPERGIGIGPSRDAFLHLCCHRSLPRTQEFRTASSGRPDRAGRPVCIAHLDSATVCQVGVPPHSSVRRASPGLRCRFCRRASPGGHRPADGSARPTRSPLPAARSPEKQASCRWQDVAGRQVAPSFSLVARRAPAATSAVRSHCSCFVPSRSPTGAIARR